MDYFYFDTSALAKRYAPEAGSEKVDSIISDKENIIVIGNIAITEIYSALSKKYRTGEISKQDFLSAVYRFEKDVSETPTVSWKLTTRSSPPPKPYPYIPRTSHL